MNYSEIRIAVPVGPDANLDILRTFLIGGFDIVAKLVPRLSVLFIDDAANPAAATTQLLQEEVGKHSWMTVHHNEKNLGVAANIVGGYKALLAFPHDRNTLVGRIDGDGEHDPVSIPRVLTRLRLGARDYDGIVGSVMYPEVGINQNQRADRYFMLYLGQDVSDLCIAANTGAGGFHIHAAGFQVHKAAKLAAALNLLDEYRQFFVEQHGTEYPRWGTDAVVDILLARAVGSRLYPAHLPCFGEPPNRTPEKRWMQTEALCLHLRTLQMFFKTTGITAT